MNEILIEKVMPNPEQPRKVIDEGSLAELAESIREQGVIQAVTVDESEDGFYILHDGERRLRAARMAGLQTIPALVVPGQNGTGPKSRLERALVANIQREGMNPIDEARAFQRLIDEHGLTLFQIGRKIGKQGGGGYAYVRNRLVWLQLETEIQELVAQGRMVGDRRVAEALLEIPNSAVRVGLAERLAQRKVSTNGCLKACQRVRDDLASQSAVMDAPGLEIGRRRAQQGNRKELPDWDALIHIGKMPAWKLIETEIRATCAACVLREMASESLCGECGVVDLTRRLLRLK